VAPRRGSHAGVTAIGVEQSSRALVTASVETCLCCRAGIFAPPATVSECAGSATRRRDRRPELAKCAHPAQTESVASGDEMLVGAAKEISARPRSPVLPHPHGGPAVTDRQGGASAPSSEASAPSADVVRTAQTRRAHARNGKPRAGAAGERELDHVGGTTPQPELSVLPSGMVVWQERVPARLAPDRSA
jgi:hypothetical protein